jgi:isochorismate hydrolase
MSGSGASDAKYRSQGFGALGIGFGERPAIVIGCNTSGCVRATIVDAFSYGLRVIVPHECCGDVDLEPHSDNLRDLGRRYADVVSLDAVTDYLNGIPNRTSTENQS